MIAWINFAMLIFATLLFLYFYFLSVSPAALENVIGHGSRVNHAEKGWATVWSWLAVSFSSAIVGSGTILMEVTLPGTLADTNPSRELARISQSVAGAPYRVIAPVTAHIEKLNVQLPENVIVIGWPPAHKINPMADISVIHGGIGTVMTAALAGKPVVGVGMQPEQDANLDCLVRKGFAIRIPKGTANARKILAAVDKLYHDDEAKRKAQEFVTIVAQWDGPRRATEFLDGEFA